jgi:hypothetical protein
MGPPGCLGRSFPVVFGRQRVDAAAQLKEVPWAKAVVCEGGRMQIQHNALCDRIERFPATLVQGRLHQGFRTAQQLERECQAAEPPPPSSPPPPPVCNQPRKASRFPTGAFLNSAWVPPRWP